MGNLVVFNGGFMARHGKYGMMLDGDISRDRAMELARMVLRENAVTLYKIGTQP